LTFSSKWGDYDPEPLERGAGLSKEDDAANSEADLQEGGV
jgi:hypothetical protein